MSEIKQIPATCEICNKQFKNIFSVSSHKVHCKLKQEGVKDTCPQLAANRGWNKDTLTRTQEEIFVENSTNSTSYVKMQLRFLN